MTPTEQHALSVAFEERHAELPRFIADYEARGWTDLAAECVIRLDELDSLARQVAAAPSAAPQSYLVDLTEGYHRPCLADYLGGPGCTCQKAAAR